jgi:hypothetical protein
MSDSIEITRHAWEQFIARWPYATPGCYLRELRFIWQDAKREELGSGGVLRLIDNGMRQATYYRNGRWRFVVSMDNRLVTVELVIHEPIFKPKYSGRKRSTSKRNRKGRW